jgi:hypothetical protein
MKATDIMYALFGGSEVLAEVSGRRKCLAEEFCGSVLGCDFCVVAK